jgi:hypothetical protein
LRRRAGDLRAARCFAAGARRVVPERLAVVFLFALFAAGLRRVAAFFFAVFAMFRSLFLICPDCFSAQNESTILEVNKMSLKR